MHKTPEGKEGIDASGLYGKGMFGKLSVGPRVTKLFGHEIKPLSRKDQQRKNKEFQKKFGFTFKG